VNGVALRGHPLHPVLAIAPLSLLAASVAMDVARLWTHDPAYAEAARWALGAGVIAGLANALLGTVDLFSYPSAARGVPIRHALLSTLGLALMAAGWWLRRDDPTSVIAISLSGVAVAATVVSRRIGMRLTPAPPRVTK
jgi:uncharacterized membrane protein